MSYTFLTKGQLHHRHLPLIGVCFSKALVLLFPLVFSDHLQNAHFTFWTLSTPRGKIVLETQATPGVFMYIQNNKQVSVDTCLLFVGKYPYPTR